ncbi:hypothetical protein [Thauera sp. WH-1]|uniref:hypothetical protein n=1 Tax=Thauera sp. WH-1 TaxID=3398230 RepID=UPI0039FBF5EC
MIKTVKQACRFNPIIRKYIVASSIEQIAEEARKSEMGSTAKVLDVRLKSLLFGK